MMKLLSPEQRFYRDSEASPRIRATTKKQILNAPVGVVIEADASLWAELGMDVSDAPSTYPDDDVPGMHDLLDES